MKKTIFLFFIFISSYSILSAQNEEDYTCIRNSSPVEQSKSTYNNSRNNKNEFELLFSAMFLLYKSVLSSQDVPSVCYFTPSCSEYGLLSIKKKGIFLGMLTTFDRLTRCHGTSSEQYFKDENSGKYIDEP